MNRRLLVVSVLFLSLGCASVALALGPLGPPVATLKQGQFGVALEYAYGDSDLEISHGADDATWGGVISNTALAQIGYGMTDNWEIYVPLGAANLKDMDLNCDYEFAYGFGTKFTIDKSDIWAWGFLFEIGWRKANDYGIVDLTDVGLSDVAYTVDLSYYDMTIALGPTYKVAEGLRLYGGPFFYILEGDMDVETAGTNTNLNLSQKSLLGAYIGAEFDLCPNSSWYGEVQFTGDMTVLGTGVSWKF